MINELSKFEMLAIRACKASRGEEMFRRLRKICEMEYLDSYDEFLLSWLFDIACKLYPNDMRWALSLGDPRESWKCGAPSHDITTFKCCSTEPSFDKNALWQITSKLRLTRTDMLPSNFIRPLKFRIATDDESEEGEK